MDIACTVDLVFPEFIKLKIMTNRLTLTATEKKQLIKLARTAIIYCFDLKKNIQTRSSDQVPMEECLSILTEKYSPLEPPVLSEPLSCFVTINSHGSGIKQLRGCIGTLEARAGESLLGGILRNSIMAAFFDSRFEPLQESELSRISIEISILSKPETLVFQTESELHSGIKGKGVVMQSGAHRATFLPQVWEQLPQSAEFLRHLAKKAGIGLGDYLHADYEIYEVYAFEESH